MLVLRGKIIRIYILVHQLFIHSGLVDSHSSPAHIFGSPSGARINRFLSMCLNLIYLTFEISQRIRLHNSHASQTCFSKKNWRTSIFFVRSRCPCFRFLVTSGLGFKARMDPSLRSSSPACNRILRFTYGATPADLLVTSMAAELFPSTYLQTSIGGARDKNVMKWSLTAIFQSF